MTTHHSPPLSGRRRRTITTLVVAALVATGAGATQVADPASAATGSSAASNAGSNAASTSPSSAAASPNWFEGPAGSPDYERSAELAYEFLDQRVDTYGSGDTPRLARSYRGGYFDTLPGGFVSSFVYDDALVIMSYLARGLPADLQRARALGSALLLVQDEDPFGDGRTRSSYQPDSLQAGVVEIGSASSFTGNQAWVGMALARLFEATGEQRFLDGALRAGEWIQTHTADTARAPFGYTGGQDADGNPFTFKATEHNIDVTAFFAQLATLTGDTVWAERSAIAAGFVQSMQAEDGHLWTGTNPDGVTTNYYPVPEDPQTWSYLATLDERYATSLDWTIDNLHATDAGYEGPSFSNADVSKVWFEGSGHLALALRADGDADDLAYANTILASVEKAQREAVNGDGRGIVAASSDELDTGFGDLYYASLHTGATAWYLMALTGYNPFRLADTAPADARADLSTTVSGVPATLARGASATVTLTVRNAGPRPATGVVASLTVGPGATVTAAPGAKVWLHRSAATWTTPSVAPGRTLTYQVTITAGARNGAALLSASALSSVRDPRWADNAVLKTVRVR